MMKVTGYVCENCDNIFKDKEIVGLIVTQPSLLDDYFGYDITNNAEKTEFHFCLACYRKHVLDLVKGIDRSINDTDYSYHYKLYSQKFYAAIHSKALLRNKTKNRRKG